MSSYGTTMMSAFSKHPPTLVPTSTTKQPSYEMPTLQRGQEYFSDRRDELDIKIADVQLSYSQALDEVWTYRVDHSCCSQSPIDIKTKVPFWPALTWPGQNITFVLMSTGGLDQHDVSPCTWIPIMHSTDYALQMHAHVRTSSRAWE